MALSFARRQSADEEAEACDAEQRRTWVLANEISSAFAERDGALAGLIELGFNPFSDIVHDRFGIGRAVFCV